MNSDLKMVDSEQQEKIVDQKAATEQTMSEIIDAHPEIEDTYLGGEYSSATIKKIRACPESISKLFKEGKYPYTDRIPKRTYEEEKEKLQIEF